MNFCTPSTSRTVLLRSNRLCIFNQQFSSKTPYEVLGVQKNSSQEDIKKAYYDKAQSLHPDKSSDPEASRKFQDLVKAYEALSHEGDQNPKHLNDYDRNKNGNFEFRSPYYKAENFRNVSDAKYADEGVNLSRISKTFHGVAAMCLIGGILFGAFKGFKVQTSHSEKNDSVVVDGSKLDDIEYKK